MADQRSDSEQRPSPEALLAEARREEKGRVGRLKIFVGAAPGVGKTYEMLQAARAKLKEGVDVVVGVVETHGRKETEALLEGLEVARPQADGLRQSHPERVRHRCRAQAAAGPDPGRRAGAHQHPRQPPSQALPGRRGAAGRRHRCLHHRQYPAYREPERRRGADHARARARSRARRHPRSRRGHRARRSDARRPDPAPEGRQGLRSQAGRARAQALLLARQSHGPARACAAADGGARRRAAARADAGARDLRAVGGGRAHSRLRQRGSRARQALCATPSGSPIACMRRGPRSTSRPGAACSSARRRGTGSPRLCGWPSDSRAKPSPCPPMPGASPTMCSSFAHKNNVTHIIIGKSTRSRWFEILHGSVVHDLVRRAGNISVHVIAGEEIAGEPIAKKTVGTTARPEPFDRCPIYWRCWLSPLSLGVGADTLAVVRARERRSRVPDRHCRRCRSPWACGHRCWQACVSALAYNFFFTAALSHVQRSPTPTDVIAVRVLRGGGGHRLQCCARRHVCG